MSPLVISGQWRRRLPSSCGLLLKVSPWHAALITPLRIGLPAGLTLIKAPAAVGAYRLRFLGPVMRFSPRDFRCRPDILILRRGRRGHLIGDDLRSED